MANYDERKPIRCSFCGKSQETVKRIIAGPGVYICNECIDLCSSIIGEDGDLWKHIFCNAAYTIDNLKRKSEMP